MIVLEVLVNEILNCRGCQETSLDKIWRLTDSPYGDLFKSSKIEALAIESFPMTLALCSSCSLLQITQVTDVKEQYDFYLYNSKVTNGLNNFYSQIANRLIIENDISKNDFVLDIGSNDGSFLSHFRDQGFTVLGIEPAKTCSTIATANGISTFNSYFDSLCVEYILQNYKIPKLISLNYTLANLPDIKEILILLKNIMNDGSVLSIITGYHPDQFSVNMFDYIGHDHLTYLTVKSMSKLCFTNGFKLIDVSRVEHKGGSIQFMVTLDSSKRQIQSSVSQLLQREEWLRISDRSFYSDLKFRIENLSQELREMINTISFNRLHGIGASISTTYFLNQFELNSYIDNLFDDDKNKIGKFAPRSGIEVLPLEKIGSKLEDLNLILAWQHTSKIISRLKEIKFKGRLIIPLPKPKLIEIY